MIKNISSDKSIYSYWEKLLHIIQSDIKDFREAIELFQNQNKNFSEGYRLIRLNDKFTRTTRAIEVIKQQGKAFNLVDVWSQIKDEEEMELLDRNDGSFKLASAFSSPQKKVNLLENKNQTCDEEIYLKQFHELFAQTEALFSDTTHTKNMLNALFQEDGELWQRVIDIEQALHRFPLWTQSSCPTDPPKEQNSESIMNGEVLVTVLGGLLQNSETTVDCCPNFEMLAAYAHYDDLRPDDFAAIKEHLSQCIICLGHVITIREAMDEAYQIRKNSLSISEKTWEFTLASMIKRHPE